MLQEANFKATSLSLSLIIPRIIAKLMPLFLIVVGITYLYRGKYFLKMAHYFGVHSAFYWLPILQKHLTIALHVFWDFYLFNQRRH